jgi:hypothetical protein
MSLAGVVAILLMVMVLPTAAFAAAGASDGPKQTRDSIFIRSAKDFNPANGVRSGMGTARDPFVISGWDVDFLEIKDTDAYVVITDNVIGNLTLDWIGGGIEVRNNDVGDLRVNQNVPRKGEATSGVIENNTFDVVGQLRHFDGVFQNNVVGSKDQMKLPFFSGRAVNFDGFNGSVFRNNTIYGYMDARIHGHHHSSSFTDASHYHGKTPESHHHAMMDHTIRYHQVHIYGNKIYAADHYYALAYLDTNHRGNDRTAASETEKTLNDPHIHYTKVFLHDNELVGSGLHVDVFNAKDELHKQGTARGLFEIRDNKIVLQPAEDPTLFGARHGIDVAQATDITLKIVNNVISGIESADQVTNLKESTHSVAGINLWQIDKGDLFLSGNTVSHAAYGIKASRFTKSVRWTISELSTTDVGQSVYWDSSVPNAPRQKP